MFMYEFLITQLSINFYEKVLRRRLIGYCVSPGSLVPIEILKINEIFKSSGEIGGKITEKTKISIKSEKKINLEIKLIGLETERKEIENERKVDTKN